jgi:hypothetical protein
MHPTLLHHQDGHLSEAQWQDNDFYESRHGSGDTYESHCHSNSAAVNDKELISHRQRFIAVSFAETLDE